MKSSTRMNTNFFLLIIFGLSKQIDSLAINASSHDLSNITHLEFSSNNSTTFSSITRVPRSYEYDDKSECTAKSNFFGDSGFLHLGLGAILSLTTILLRTYVPTILMRIAGRNGRAVPNSDTINWVGLGQWVLEATDDPLVSTFNALMEASIKSKSKVNATVGNWEHLDCANQLICQTTTKDASTLTNKQKLQSLSRTAVLLMTLQSSSFFDLMHPIVAGHFSYNCTTLFPLCNWKKLL